MEKGQHKDWFFFERFKMQLYNNDFVLIKPSFVAFCVSEGLTVLTFEYKIKPFEKTQYSFSKMFCQDLYMLFNSCISRRIHCHLTSK